jgi:hypothetical protein
MIETSKKSDNISETRPPVEKRNKLQHNIREVFEERVEGSNFEIHRTIS